MSNKSCLTCKYLYCQDSGYSNYTVMETYVNCALEKNPNLPAEEPVDWDKQKDNWYKTNTSRCIKYSTGPLIYLDVDLEVDITTMTTDQEAIDAIKKHAKLDQP